MKLIPSIIVIAFIAAGSAAQAQGGQPLSSICKLQDQFFDGHEVNLGAVGFPPSSPGTPCSYGNLKGVIVAPAGSHGAGTQGPCSRTPDGRGITGNCTAADKNPTLPDFRKKLPDEFAGRDLVARLREGAAKRCIREFGFDKGYECTVRHLAYSFVTVTDQEYQVCQQKHPNDGLEALNCVAAHGMRAAMEPDARAMADCVREGRTEDERARCLIDRVPSNAKDNLAGILRCIRNESTLAGATRCAALNAAVKSADPQMQTAADCIERHPSMQAAANCISGRVSDTNPELSAVAGCLQRSGTDADRSKCVLDRVVAGAGQDAREAAACLSEPTLSASLSCAALSAAQRSGSKETAVAARCFRKNGLSQKAFDCVAGGLAEQHVARDTLSALRCVSQHGVSTKAALCGVVDTLALSVNNETSTAINCVTKFGPSKAAVVCAAVGLTVAEFEKCLSSGGADCLGPNNDLRRFVEDQMNAARREVNPATALVRFTTGVSLKDIEKHGPLGGENSDARKICDGLVKTLFGGSKRC